jgi:FlaA1/EpsC-like NDP-sugar epimerase
MIKLDIDQISPLQRRLILIVADIILATSSVVLSFFLLYPKERAIELLSSYYLLIPIFVIARIFSFQLYKLYDFSWRYASTKEFIKIVSATTAGTAIIAGTFFMLKINGFPTRVIALDWAYSMLLCGSTRAALRMYRDYLVHRSKKSANSKRNVLIVGAGDAGEMIAREITRAQSLEYNLIGFIDDKKSKSGKRIHNTPVLGTTADLPSLVTKHNITEVIIAIPSARGKGIRRIMELCEKAKVKFKITPGLSDIIGGRVSVNQLREVSLADLLRRDVVDMDVTAISEYLSNTVVLVTGAGGSIGSELCRQILRFSPKTLLLLDHDENAVYSIHRELLSVTNRTTQLVPIVADIKDEARLEFLFKEHAPKAVFHAAAHKHVPLMEENVREVVLNNVRGTMNMLQLSDKHEANIFVQVSTDKAVRPTNCMGATKRLGEVLLMLLAKTSKTKFCAVRFGNVLGSQGSVVPLFKEQIAKGGPVTVTHPEMTRFFMTIPEAVRLIIEAGALGKGGEIFILDMGEPVKIIDLARDLIYLSGLEEGNDIDIEVVGLRPGEKLYEELFFDKSELTKTHNKKIFVTAPTVLDANTINAKVDDLFSLCESHDNAALREALLELVKSTEPAAG